MCFRTSQSVIFVHSGITFMHRFTPFATSFRRKFYAYYHAMKHHHINVILSLFSIPFVLKCAANILKIGS